MSSEKITLTKTIPANRLEQVEFFFKQLDESDDEDSLLVQFGNTEILHVAHVFLKTVLEAFSDLNPEAAAKTVKMLLAPTLMSFLKSKAEIDRAASEIMAKRAAQQGKTGGAQ